MGFLYGDSGGDLGWGFCKGILYGVECLGIFYGDIKQGI